MDLRGLYNVRDLPHGGGWFFGSLRGGHIFLRRALGELDQMRIHILEREVLLLRL